MSRTFFMIAGVFSVPGLLLLDSAVKGAVLLLLAALVAAILRRDSAATRHFVWLTAIVALLAAPLLSALLPQWRVLPRWVDSSPQPVAMNVGLPAITRPVNGAVEWPPIVEPIGVELPGSPVHRPVVESTSPGPGDSARESATWQWSWSNALPLVWVIGFSLLMLRLLAARWMLWNRERQATAIEAEQSSNSPPDPLVTALDAVGSQLGITRRITLLIHPDKTIPVVWGILRCRLLLPAAARQWNDEQLRSVLLHELAHIKRRDTTAQLLTQIACALHWFNPLVWFAAWRLDVERERACDDLVLAHGVRPSAYAGHLLEVVTGHAPRCWTPACGLAMARKSSLEGRLAAVLGGRNRRGVTRFLAAAAVVLAAAVAIPLAMLRAAGPDEPKPEAAAVNAEPPAGPKDDVSRPLFEHWKTHARSDGKIPGGCIGEMAASLKTYMDLNAGTEPATKCEPVLKKCDATHDWTPAEATALLDEIEIAAPSRAEWTMRDIIERQIHPGKPLPKELKNAPWGSPPTQRDASSVALLGLRMAWLLEPRQATQPLDSVMKSRVLFHNTSRTPVCFATEDWIQSGTHSAKDASGADINVWAVSRMGIRTRMIFRLAPGEYAEVVGHGIGVGSHETSTEKSIYNVGAWIEAKEGDAVTFKPGVIPVSFRTWKNNEGQKDSITVWREMIASRVMQESPMPASAADRELLFRRVTADFPGAEPTAEEIAAFVADDAKDALAQLIDRLQLRCFFMHFDGELTGGETKFRVTAAAPKKEEPKGGAQLKPATEQKLKWGETVNGLRMALAWPPSLGEAGMGDAPEFYLVVQNVSEAAVPLIANDAAPNPRRLTMWDLGIPLSAISDPTPMPGDWLLQPREAAYLRLFQRAETASAERNVAPEIEKSFRVYPNYSATAEMTIEKAPEGAWTGKLATARTRGSVDVIPPKLKDAQALYQSWTTAQRTDGKIPGGLIGLLGESVKVFIKSNPTWETTPQLEKMQFDASHDWTGPDAVALLDELAALQATPIRMALDREAEAIIRTGTPLPADLATAPWGETLENGLRHAWLLEPRAKEHRLGTPLKARVLIHNASKTPVVFRTRNWHQLGHTARDANGAAINVESTSWTTRGLLTTFRLAPGEYIEVTGPGIGVGPKGNSEDWQNTRVGSWVEAKAGDEVTVTTSPLPLSDWNDKPELDGEPRWWLDHISARLARHTPFPADAEARLRLLHLVAIEVLGTSVSKQMNDALVADHSPTALEAAAMRLVERPGLSAWAGPLISGPTKFRVLPADPDAAKKPRTTGNPGRYTLSDKAWLQVSRVRRDRDSMIIMFAPTLGAPGDGYKVQLPDGHGGWAAAWIRGGSVLWVSQKGLLRKVDFTDLANVQETRFEDDAIAAAPVPPDIGEALRAALAAPEAPKQVQKPVGPPAAAAPAATKPVTPPPKDGAAARPTADGYVKSGSPIADLDAPITWGAEQNGLSLGMSFAADADWRIGNEVKAALWVRNAGRKDAKFENSRWNDLGLRVLMTGQDGKEHAGATPILYLGRQFEKLLLPAGHAVQVREFAVVLSPPESGELSGMQPRFKLAPGAYKFHCEHDLLWTVVRGADGKPLKPATDVRTGLLQSAEVEVTLKAVEAPAAKPPGEGEIVFITRETQRQFPQLDAGQGVTLEIHGHVFHGTDVQTSVRIRWPAQDGVVTGHDESIAMDAFANREKWAIGWVRGTKTFWHVSNDLDGRTPGHTRLHRTTFANPQRIVSDYDANYPGEPIDGLGLPPELEARFEQYFGIAQPQIVDKSGGLPDVSGRFVHAAQPVQRDGSLPEMAAIGPLSERRWKVQFVDRDSGQPAPGVRVRLHVQNANGSESYDVVRIVSGDEGLEPSLAENQFATIEVVDDHYRGGGGSRAFGNVPADWLAAEKHTDPEQPFVVKVWPTSRDPQREDDALWNTKTPFEKIPVAIANWSAEQNGLRLGMRVLADEGWRVGGQVKVELWLHNPGAKDLWLVANPGRSDVGVSVAATDSNGQDHYAENGNVMIIAIPLHCVLPAGHVAKVKEFTLSFDAPGNEQKAWFEPKFRELEAGAYILRCHWSDAHPLVSAAGEWTGSVTSGPQKFTLEAPAA